MSALRLVMRFEDESTGEVLGESNVEKIPSDLLSAAPGRFNDKRQEDVTGSVYRAFAELYHSVADQ